MNKMREFQLRSAGRVALRQSMLAHKFAVGARVRFLQRALSARHPDPGSFTVVRQMPAAGEGPMYRVKGDNEAYERVALERQLDASF